MTHHISQSDSPMTRILPFLGNSEAYVETFVGNPCAKNLAAIWIGQSFGWYDTFVFLAHIFASFLAPMKYCISGSGEQLACDSLAVGVIGARSGSEPPHVGCYIARRYDLMSRAWNAEAPMRKAVRLKASRTQRDSATRCQDIGWTEMKSSMRQ